MSLTTEQEAAVRAPGSVAVTAGAGTGKTHMLAERYLHQLETLGLSPLELVAVTFTEKAAAELRARIRSLAARRLPDRPDALAELEAAPISTLHALAARICREHAEAAGVPADFQVLDEQSDGKLWLAEQFAAVLDELAPHVYDSLSYSLLHHVLTALLDDPLTAAAALERPLPDPAALAAEARAGALADLLADPEWDAATDAIVGAVGPAGDRHEERRALAEDAIHRLDTARRQGTDPRDAAQALKDLDLRGGSKKGWDESALEAVKAALKFMRDTIRKTPLLFVEPGPADDQLEALLPALREAFAIARDRLTAAKREARVLTFSDLEVHALKALEDPAVRAYYASRWKAFMIDEFQDTNPIQAQLLDALVGDAALTIVGDEKQSIYGFRRADVRVFQRFRTRILDGQGAQVALSQSFRTHHALVEATNRTFAPILQHLHQDLVAARSEAPHPGPHVRLLTLTPEKGPGAEDHRRAEARRLAREFRAMLDAGTPVWDKATKTHRPIRPDDMAILCRTSQPLQLYGEALAAEGLPAVLSAGGNLLDTREALDGIALLRFLAVPTDNLALVAALRSPFFAVSDPVLYAFSQTVGDRPWWIALSDARPPELERAFAILQPLMRARRREAPTRLLQIADHHCGYTAILANLPGAARREADWAGFLNFLRTFEAGAQDVFTVVRRLKRHLDAGLEVERPPLEPKDAVALMTIHGSKGLEWPVVAIANCTGKGAPETARILFDADLGCALRFLDDTGETQEPVLFTVLKRRKQALEDAEERRIYYVALTRARDLVLLTAPAEKGGALDFLLPGLAAAGIAPEATPFDPADALPPELPPPAPMVAPTRELLTPLAVAPHYPATALSLYRHFPFTHTGYTNPTA